MPSSTKIDLMEHGFGQLGLKKIGDVTFDQFAKANTTYRETAASGSNTGEMHRALKAFKALADKAFPNGPDKKNEVDKNVTATRSPKTIEELSPGCKGKCTPDE